MEKLSMCRICLSDDTRLQSLFGTHLQEMYEFLTMTPLVAEDSRPSLACDLCCSRLETCYELRAQSLCSEELFTQLLRHKAQVNLRVMPNIHPSMEDVVQTTSDVLDNGDVKQEDAEDDAQDDDDSHAYSEDDTAICNVIKMEPEVDALEPNDAAVEQDGADPYHSALGLHTECDIPLDIVKEEPDDVDTGAPRLAAQKYRNDTLLNSPKITDQTMDKVEERKRETRRDIEDTPVEKKEIVETGGNIDIRLHHDKQNNSTSDHSYARKEMSENKYILLYYINNNYECNVCRKCFIQKRSLDSHMHTHTGEKPYECNVCRKCFIRKGSLDAHMRTHTVEKRNECNVCKKCFHRKDYIAKHMRIHTGEKPYECNLCKLRFIQKGYFNTHMRLHTGEEPYECNVCKQRFIQKRQLNNHIRTHSGEKPHECNVCKKRFIKKGQLNNHIRTHPGEKPHECNVCKKRFIKKGSLDLHYADTHR